MEFVKKTFRHSCLRASFLAFFGLLQEAEYIINTYLTYHIENLCIYTTVYILSGPPSMTKGRPPTTMLTVPPCGYNYVVYYVYMVYRIAAKYSNESVFQHCFKEVCRITSWKDMMPQRAHDQGASNATFGWRLWYHLAKLHVCEVCKAFEYLEVIRYAAYRASWMLGKVPSSILTGAQSDDLEIEHTNKKILIIGVTWLIHQLKPDHR